MYNPSQSADSSVLLPPHRAGLVGAQTGDYPERVRRALVVSALLPLLAGVALGATSSHLTPAPRVDLRGAASVPPGIHFSPVRDPRQGRWDGSITWSIGCAGAERWSWSVQFADVASGSYGLPPETRPRERSQSAFFYDGSGFSTSSGSSRVIDVPAGSFVFPYVEGNCYGGSHWSARGHADGEPLFVPPYVWYPTISTVKGRRLQSVESGAVVLRKGRTVVAQLRVGESAVRNERVEVRLAGAGVDVRKQYRPEQLDRPVSVRFRPTKVGVVRYWVVVKPYAVRSLVYGLRVKR